jgi:hypothetical protein
LRWNLWQLARRPNRVDLCLLDAVLCFAAGAVQLFVQGRAIALQTGDDEARISPTRIVFQPRNHMAFAIP